MKFLLALILALACVSVIFARTEEEACAGKCDAEKALKCVARWSCQPREACGNTGDWIGSCVPDHTAANTCQLPLVSGLCRAGMRSWGFNRNKGQCEQFVYGGCRGNGNRFSSMKKCEERCLMK